MIQIDLKNKNNQVVIGKIDHEKKETAFSANGEEIAVLAIKNHTYEVGDKLVITKEKNDHYFVVQLDETLAPTLLYIPEKKWEYVIPLEETKASVETGFRSKRHHIYVRKAYDFEVESYRNVSTNPHDQKLISGAYPHAYANVETRNDVTFLLKMRLTESLVIAHMDPIHLLLGESISKKMQL